jgi:hypothetical protein
LEVGANALDGSRPRVSAVAQIEHKAWISNRFASETGRRRVILAKKFLNVAK